MATRIVVTGGCGFIGRHLVRELLNRGYDVRVVDTLAPPDSQEVFTEEVDIVRGDLSEKPVATSALKGMDICISLAARSSGLGYFNRHPGEMLNDNVRITSATFEAARDSGLGRIIYVSSSCVFDKSTAVPTTESAFKASPPPSPGYPFSKLVGEAYCEAYSEQYGLAYTIIRPFNVYGRGEMPAAVAGDSHVIPDLTNKILRGQDSLEIFGDGLQTRCFTHVKDIVRGLILALENPRAENEDFNLGHSREITIIDLAELLWSLCGRKESFSVRSIPSYKNDVRRRVVDPTKAKKLLNWEPSVSLERGLSDYIEWLRKRMTM
jgi:UDP-glucose 4-epimerase